MVEIFKPVRLYLTGLFFILLPNYLVSMKKIIVLLLLLLISSNFFFAQNTFSVDLQKNSSITIHGTTNLLSFKLIQTGEKLTKRNFIITASENHNKIILSQNEHTILVKDFSSENKMAQRDFLKLVKADMYPSFHVKVNYFEIDPNTINTDQAKATVSVDLTITGKTKQYSIPVKSVRDGDNYKLNGNKKINIRDFGLDPPVEMMGLIRVSEWINIDFNIICRISDYKSSGDYSTPNVPVSSHGRISN